MQPLAPPGFAPAPGCAACLGPQSKPNTLAEVQSQQTPRNKSEEQSLAHAVHLPWAKAGATTLSCFRTWLQLPPGSEAQFNGFALVLLDPINDKNDKHICVAFIAISRFDMIPGKLPMLSA